jgi:predicted MFS family arabinose efflux permease
MVMTGSAIGPFLGGTLVVAFGYAAIGYAVVVIGLVAASFLSRIKEHSIQTGPATPHLA